MGAATIETLSHRSVKSPPMKLFGDPTAPTTQMVLLTFAEKASRPELVRVALAKGEQQSPENCARHPFGLTPTVEDEHGYHHEARAIIRYLDRALAGPALTPSALREFASMERFIGIEQAYFSPSIMLHFYKRFLGRSATTAALEAARATAGKALDQAAAALVKGPYLAGDAISLADIAWMPYLGITIATENGDLIQSRPPVQSWWERLTARPSWQQLHHSS